VHLKFVAAINDSTDKAHFVNAPRYACKLSGCGLFVIALAVRGSERFVKSRKKKLEDLKARMATAAKLLKESDRSVAEIAIAVGAESPSSFERDFARIYGVKPLDYKKGK